MRKRSITAALVTGSTVLATALTSQGSASASPSRSTIPHTKPAWTAHARQLGNAKAAGHVRTRVYLAPRGGTAAMKTLATQVSTPGNANYHHFLSAKQFKARFGITSATVHSVSSYLESSGLRITRVGVDNRYLVARGSVSAAEKAFGTQLARFRYKGRTVRAPLSPASVPAGIAASILTVRGLDTTPLKVVPTNHTDAAPSNGFRNARPCSRYYGQVKASVKADFTTPLPQFAGKTLAYAPCGYTGPQFRQAYEGSPNLYGDGVTVAITDAYASPTIASDAETYGEAHGDGGYGPGQLTQTLPAAGFNRQGQCGPSGWYGEETLDVEAVHAMAPDANIHFYASPSCFDNDFLDTLANVVDDDDAQIVSNSWGDVEEAESADSVAAYESVFLQGAIEGISFVFSSGDNGDEVAHTAVKQSDYPTSDPYVTSVGGTSTGINSGGNLQFETGWGTVKYSLSGNGATWNPVGYLYGAGGGTSGLFNRPSYQDGTVSTGGRSVPDVAMDADPNTGMLIGQTQAFPDGNYYDEFRIGGTSLAAPLFAGMTALSLENGGSAVGLLNPTIYANQGDFTDVTAHNSVPGDVRVDYANGVDPTNGLLYSVRTFNQDSSLPTLHGYDQVTGVGSANPGWLDAFTAP